MLPFQHFQVYSVRLADDLHKKSTRNWIHRISFFVSFWRRFTKEMLTSDYHFKCYTNIIKASMFNAEMWAGFRSRLITRYFANYSIFMRCEEWSVKSASEWLTLNCIDKKSTKCQVLLRLPLDEGLKCHRHHQPVCYLIPISDSCNFSKLGNTMEACKVL